MTPYAHQQALLTENPARRLLSWATGVGKTPALIWLAEQNDCERILVVCPKGIKEQWKKKLIEFNARKTYSVVTKEEFKKHWQEPHGIDAIIIDEVHHFSGITSQLHKSMIKYLKLHQPKYVWTASATPFRSEPFNIYALGLIHAYAPLTWMQFRQKFYHIRYLGHRTIWEKNTGEETQEALRKYMTPFTSFARLEDCFDLPPQIDEEPEIVGLSPEQKRAIKYIEETETNPLVSVSSRHQIENGALKGNEFKADAEYENLKDGRILELAEEHPKLLIFCRFNLQIERLARRLKEVGLQVIVITGENSADHFILSRQAEVSDRCVLIAQISVAAGWEVPSFPVVVYASQSYSYLDFVQSRGRVIRGNNLGHHVFLFIHSDEVDKAVYQCITEKRDFDPVLWEKE